MGSATTRNWSEQIPCYLATNDDEKGKNRFPALGCDEKSDLAATGLCRWVESVQNSFSSSTVDPPQSLDSAFLDRFSSATLSPDN